MKSSSSWESSDGAGFSAVPKMAAKSTSPVASGSRARGRSLKGTSGCASGEATASGMAGATEGVPATASDACLGRLPRWADPSGTKWDDVVRLKAKMGLGTVSVSDTTR